MKGFLKGHFSKEIKKAVVETIKNAINEGMTQKMACNIFGISIRKYRRWSIPKQAVIHEAWNKIIPAEKEAIIETVHKPEFWDKPISHIFVHGHDTNSFYASIPTIYRVLKEQSIVRQLKRQKRSGNYIGVHELLDAGFSLLCYDGTRFVTDTYSVQKSQVFRNYVATHSVLKSHFQYPIRNSAHCFPHQNLPISLRMKKTKKRP